MAPPCTFGRCFNRDKTGGVIKMTASPTARLETSVRDLMEGKVERESESAKTKELLR